MPRIHQAVRSSREVAWLLRGLRSISETMASEIPLAEALERVLEGTLWLIRADGGSIMLVDPERGDLVYRAWLGLTEDEVRSIRFRLGEGVAGWVAKHGRPALVNRPEKDRRFRRSAHQAKPIRALLCVPLHAAERVVGVVTLHHAGARRFARIDGEILSLVATQISMGIVRHRLEEIAVTDPLTGLRNRRYLEAQLEREVERCRRTGSRLSVAMIDLDGFKEVNDRLGHEEGDRRLRRAAMAIRGAVRAMDEAVRYGGDEFVLVLPEAGEREAAAVTERVRQALRVVQPASIGLAAWRAGEDARRLLRRADQALYRAKRDGAGGGQVAGRLLRSRG